MTNSAPEEVVVEVKECQEHAGVGGGNIISTDHSIHDDVLTANLLAMIKV